MEVATLVACTSVAGCCLFFFLLLSHKLSKASQNPSLCFHATTSKISLILYHRVLNPQSNI